MRKQTAEMAVEALNLAFGDCGQTACAALLADQWYVITSNAGEDCAYAYEPDDVPVRIDVPVRVGKKWDYIEWFNNTSPVVDRDVAIEAYRDYGIILGSLEGDRILTDEDRRVLEWRGKLDE